MFREALLACPDEHAATVAEKQSPREQPCVPPGPSFLMFVNKAIVTAEHSACSRHMPAPVARYARAVCARQQAENIHTEYATGVRERHARGDVPRVAATPSPSAVGRATARMLQLPALMLFSVSPAAIPYQPARQQARHAAAWWQ